MRSELSLLEGLLKESEAAAKLGVQELETTAKAFRTAQADALLVHTPLSALHQVDHERKPMGALKDAGIANVGQLLEWSPQRLQRLGGVGPVMSERVSEAAKRLHNQVLAQAPTAPKPNLGERGAPGLARALLNMLDVRRMLSQPLTNLQRLRKRWHMKWRGVLRETRFSRWLFHGTEWRAKHSRVLQDAHADLEEVVHDPAAAAIDRALDEVETHQKKRAKHKELESEFRACYADACALLDRHYYGQSKLAKPPAPPQEPVRVPEESQSPRPPEVRPSEARPVGDTTAQQAEKEEGGTPDKRPSNLECKAALIAWMRGDPDADEVLAREAVSRGITVSTEYAERVGNEPTTGLRSTTLRPLSAEAPSADARDYGDEAELLSMAPYAVTQGGVPAEVAERIEQAPLNAEDLRVDLRIYQEFGAKFILEQRRVVLGDEMGLGKTVEALAVMTHLAAEDETARFLVVAPAGLVPNWIQEIRQRSDLPFFSLVGNSLTVGLHQWLTHGGIALVSYTTMTRRSLPLMLGKARASIDLLVCDEAHYVKNPRARRTKGATRVASMADRVCLMTGTPMENRPEEFINLMHVLGVDGTSTADIRQLTGLTVNDRAAEFRSHVAEIYLRRNQRDVLKELPEAIEMEEWVDLSEDELQGYRLAVMDGHIMGMRRAATVGPHGVSAKIKRMLELLEEHRAEGRKVLVFSFFLDVLQAVAERAPDVSCILAGSMPQDERMRVIRKFSDSPGHKILVAQIRVGGQGLNLQAASAVILMEPQFNPAWEDQAVGRAKRMGQTEAVLVHRLLAHGSCDEYLHERLMVKRATFDRFVRDSDLKNASPAALDKRVGSEMLAHERQRLSEAI